MKKKLLIVIFSYNRAMQIDCLLRTTIERLKFENYIIKIIFHTAGNHANGYKKLVEKYRVNSNIEFIERQKINSFWNDKFPLLLKNRNLWRYVKNKYLRTPLDNFKKLTETIIENSECEFSMFLTDDGYFYRDVIIPENIFDKIRNNPFHVSYRMYVGKNLCNCPDDLEIEENLFKWNYYDSKMTTNWAYPFSVDATIYHSKTLLKIIHPVFYHMPTTLESFVVTYCQSRKLLSIGYSPLESNYLGLFINRVSTIGNNFSGKISTDLLNEKWMEGYKLDYIFTIPPDQNALIPKQIILKNPINEEIIL